MKKLTYILAAAAVLALTACEDDKTPVYHGPDKVEGNFTINEPSYASQTLVLSPDGTMTIGVYEQPHYGAPIVVTYSALMALTEEALYLDPETGEMAGKVVELIPSSSPTAPNLTFKQSEVAIAICDLHGFDYDTYEQLPAAPLYIRMKAEVKHVDNSTCYSNIIKLDKVEAYNAIPLPVNAYAYFDNSETGWDKVYVWAWNDEGNCTSSGNWPGDEMTIDAETGYYMWTGPASKAPTQIIFSNGDGIQTADLKFYDQATYNFNGSMVATAYYADPNGWANPYVWAWSDDANCTASGAWPGDPMFKNVAGVWQWNSPVGKIPTFIIFANDKGSEQTIDIPWDAATENGKVFDTAKR